MDDKVWFYLNHHNWSVSNLSDGKQTFTNIDDGVADLLFHNVDTSNVDTILVKYFENSNDETKRKILIRE